MTRQPGYRRLLWGGSLLYVLLLGGTGILVHLLSVSPEGRPDILLIFAVAACINVAALVILFAVLHRLIFRPLYLLNQGVEIVAGVNSAYEFDLPRHHLLGNLPKAVENLSTAFLKAKREMAEALAAGAGEMEDRKTQLETVLNSLREGVIVCDDRARILFYNSAVRRLFYDNEALGLGRSLYLLCARDPVENSLAILRQRKIRNEEMTEEEKGVRFVCTTIKEGALLHCHIRMLPVMPARPWSFVFTCEDVSHQVDILGRRDNRLRSLVSKMRAPLTNLSVSAEGLNLYPGLAAETRSKFEQIIVQETHILIEHFDRLAHEIQEMVSAQYADSDVFAGDLVACVAKKLKSQGVQLTMTGDPLWVYADSVSLLLLLEFLALKIRDYCGAGTIEIQTLLGDKRVYFDYCWQGSAIPQSELQRWLSELTGPAGFTVSEVLERHGSDIWSNPHAISGYAILRLPVPSSPNQWGTPEPVLPERPVYHDFAVLEPAADVLTEQALDRLTFIVFDTETTGLSPLDGDEIVSLAGVKVFKGGIIVGEIFDKMVNPCRTIPRESVRFHGITEEMVKDKPKIGEVLRSFHSYVGNAVLVGHNAAFDMRFIRMKEQEAGVRFRNPVLDTLSLSLYLHDHTPEHSLDAIAQRLGVEIRGRHTARGDSLITAEIFLRLLYLLMERGITTLGKAMEVSRR
ncbi:MAG: exonuclease domain-containing protein [Nitrospirota bacterium]|nr:exonuclease domain-containing protein [Nitrospirota bacterium]